ncbi:agrin-like [Ornithodoros turicata]|uniref:agrin-like n=1 Tax=Ornithodoros turicata TaxID=34597 RepID=UPI003138AC30
MVITNSALKLACVLMMVLLVEGRRRRIYSECSERAIQEREDEANVVVSATVERLLHSGAQVSARVKRVLKGPRELNGSVVLITGLDDPELCDAKLKGGDTRLFVLHFFGDSGAEMRALASPLRMTLPNLDKLQAAVNDEPYRRRPHIIDLPCETKYCSWNGDCSETTHYRSSAAHCSCPTNCVHHPGAVCGHDGKTYASHCRLRVDSCHNQKTVWVKHQGHCTSF